MPVDPCTGSLPLPTTRTSSPSSDSLDLGVPSLDIDPGRRLLTPGPKISTTSSNDLSLRLGEFEYAGGGEEIVDIESFAM